MFNILYLSNNYNDKITLHYNDGILGIVLYTICSTSILFLKYIKLKKTLIKLYKISRVERREIYTKTTEEG